MYLVFTNKKLVFLFYTIHGNFRILKAGSENAKPKCFENKSNFGSKFFL